MRAVRLVATAAALATVAGCYSGPGTEDPTSKGGSTLPLGIATPAPGRPSPGAITGVFATATPDDPDCCWLGASASFPVRARRAATTLHLEIFIPDIKVFQQRTQSVTVSVDGGRKQSFAGLTPGRHEIDAALPPHRSRRFVRVEIEPGFTFVPIKERITQDGRVLSLYLRDVKVR